MRLYLLLARLNWPRSYIGKILLVSFIGVHVPMIGAVTFVLLADPTPLAEQLDVLGAMLVATLIGTTMTMLAMGALLAPIRAATRAIDGYLRNSRLPRLPSRLPDEAGILMARIQEGITRLDGALIAAELHRSEMRATHHDKFAVLSGMSHDFRTPLNHILGFAELMKAEAMGPLGTEAYREFASTIGESGTELLETLQSILALSEAETAFPEAAAAEPFDAGHMLDDVIALEHLHAQNRGVSVIRTGLASAEVAADAKAAREAVGVMLQIAIAGSAERSSVAASVGTTPRGEIVVSVSDRAGVLYREDVPPELRGLVPDLPSFAGTETAARPQSSPTALRLSLLATLARLVGAELGLAHEQGRGKTLSLRFGRRALAPLAAAA